MGKRYKCPYCDTRKERKELISHINRKHEDMMPEDYSADRVVYNYINKKDHGTCRVCKKPTGWNEKTGRYDVLCGNPKCKEAMREEYKKNMLRVKGTYNILNDPEQQKIMLANRKISGKYKFTDGGIVDYTGSYEHKFLEFMDIVMGIKSNEILSPGPTMQYMYNGESHIYIPDFYYVPYNLIIEVKDGGDNLNTKDSPGMRASREKTIEKERVITDRGEYNYVRLTNNNFAQIIEIFMELKEQCLNGIDKPIVNIHESYIAESENRAEYDSNHKKKSSNKNFKYFDIQSNKKEFEHYAGNDIAKDKDYIYKNFIGEIVVDMDTETFAGYILIWKSGKNKGFIQPLWIFEEYRGYGLGTKLLKDAIGKYGAIDLTVDQDNRVAIEMYKKNNFVIINDNTNEKDAKQYYMKLKSKLTKDDKEAIEEYKDIKESYNLFDFELL